MKLRAAALSIVAVVAATPAMAQYWYAPGYQGSYAPRPYYRPRPYGYDGVPPYEVAAIVRSANLQPVSRPWRNGANFFIRATNARGEFVRVVIDAYRGRIIAIAAADTAPTAGLAPDPRIEGMAPEYDEQGNPLPPRPVQNTQRPAPEHKRTAAVTPIHPPLPRPRPVPASVTPPAPPAPQAPAAAPTPTPPVETVPQPTETPTGGNTGTNGAAPAGSGSSFPPVAPLE